MPPRLLLLLPALLLLLRPAAAQTNPVSTKPALTNVTVYLNGTALEHRGEITLAPGLNRVLVNGLAPLFNEENLEVVLGEGAELQSVGADDDPATDDDPAEPVPRSKAQTDSLARTQAALRRTEAELQGLQQEKAFLLANQTLAPGTQANWSTEVQKGAALMRTRLPAIQLETERLTTRLQTLKESLTALQAAPGPKLDATQEVLLVRATRAGTVPLTLRYFLKVRTTWLPRLDIRANATGRELDFVTHGRLRNRTRLDWRRVRVVLMRHALDEEVARPVLTPWELNYRENDNSSQGEGRVDAFVVRGTAKGQPADLVQSTRYEVPELMTLPVNGVRDLVLPAVKLAGQPEYLAVPRVSEHAILQAKVSGWQGLPLADRAGVYRQGMYVGETELDTKAYNDSLAVALGHDDLLVVGRAKLEDKSSDVALSDKRRVRLTYELNVRNRHPETSVKLIEASGAQLEARTGMLTWLLTVPAGASQKVRFTFQVEYPKDKGVDLINRVQISKSPKFR
jgi:hypothetical protein